MRKCYCYYPQQRWLLYAYLDHYLPFVPNGYYPLQSSTTHNIDKQAFIHIVVPHTLWKVLAALFQVSTGLQVIGLCCAVIISMIRCLSSVTIHLVPFMDLWPQSIFTSINTEIYVQVGKHLNCPFITESYMWGYWVRVCRKMSHKLWVLRDGSRRKWILYQRELCFN